MKKELLLSFAEILVSFKWQKCLSTFTSLLQVTIHRAKQTLYVAHWEKGIVWKCLLSFSWEQYSLAAMDNRRQHMLLSHEKEVTEKGWQRLRIPQIPTEMVQKGIAQQLALSYLLDYISSAFFAKHLCIKSFVFQ